MIGSEHDLSSGRPTGAFFPILSWVNVGHPQFDRVCPIHFFAANLGDFSHNPQASGQISVESPRQFAHQAGTDE